jgi:peptide/nickel transport system ATP-binding protein/oligopeptide transport system ATP-binding protein
MMVNDDTRGKKEEDSLLVVEDLQKYFPIKSGVLKRQTDEVKAVDGVSLSIDSGEAVGLVGESGCGKSTLGKTIMRILEPTGGRVYYEGEDLMALSKSELRRIRRDIQIIFQDPSSSLNPHMNVIELIEEPMRALTDWPKKKRRERSMELIQEVGLKENHLYRAPHELSGGQKQRVAIARALSVNPKLIIADEPTSALDVSVQAKILNLMRDLQEDYDLTYILISHDLSVVRHICTRVAVMYLGELVEISPMDQLFEEPKHPYTRALLSSVPRASPIPMSDRIILEGTVPSPREPPSGCRYHTRCQEYIGEICESENPELTEIDDEHVCACHHYLE